MMTGGVMKFYKFVQHNECSNKNLNTHRGAMDGIIVTEDQDLIKYAWKMGV